MLTVKPWCPNELPYCGAGSFVISYLKAMEGAGGNRGLCQRLVWADVSDAAAILVTD